MRMGDERVNGMIRGYMPRESVLGYLWEQEEKRVRESERERRSEVEGESECVGKRSRERDSPG